MTLTTWFAIGIVVIGLGTLQDYDKRDYYKNLLKGSIARKFGVLVAFTMACFVWPVRLATMIVDVFKMLAKR